MTGSSASSGWSVVTCSSASRARSSALCGSGVTTFRSALALPVLLRPGPAGARGRAAGRTADLRTRVARARRRTRARAGVPSRSARALPPPRDLTGIDIAEPIYDAAALYTRSIRGSVTAMESPTPASIGCGASPRSSTSAWTTRLTPGFRRRRAWRSARWTRCSGCCGPRVRCCSRCRSAATRIMAGSATSTPPTCARCSRRSGGAP